MLCSQKMRTGDTQMSPKARCSSQANTPQKEPSGGLTKQDKLDIVQGTFDMVQKFMIQGGFLKPSLVNRFRALQMVVAAEVSVAGRLSV